MSSLLERIQVVSSLTDTIGSNLDSNRGKVDKLVSVRRLLKKLQFLFDLPSRLQRCDQHCGLTCRCIELEAYDQAVEYYTSSTLVLNDYRHLRSFRTIQDSSDSLMHSLQSKMLSVIQQPSVRMTQLEDFVRLLLKLGHSAADLSTIYLNYHRDRLTAIIDKYLPLQPLSDDEKEIIALSGSEQEVNAQRQQREVTAKYPLLQFMGMVEKVAIFGSVENRNLSNCYCMSLSLMRIFSRIMR